jgi:hypothetical protein
VIAQSTEALVLATMVVVTLAVGRMRTLANVMLVFTKTVQRQALFLAQTLHVHVPRATPLPQGRRDEDVTNIHGPRHVPYS